MRRSYKRKKKRGPVQSKKVSYDGIKIELKSIEELLKLEQKKVILKDSVISSLNGKVINLTTIISKKDEQFGLEREKSKQLLTELKKEKRKTFFYKLGTYAAGILGIIVLTK